MSDIGNRDPEALPFGSDDKETIQARPQVPKLAPPWDALQASGHSIEGQHGPSAPAAPAHERGDMLGRYVVLERIGHGGMGSVYAAYDPHLDRKVAVKVLHQASDLELTPSDARDRLLREAHSLARLNHRNVVTVFDVGRSHTDVFIAMEYVRGKHLGKWLGETPRSIEDILEVFRAAGEGLAAAHSEGIVHRDIKPENLIVGDDGIVRVIDFGIAGTANPKRNPSETLAIVEPNSAESSPVSNLTQAGTIMGTPAYMAPEQFKAEAVDHRTDQFGFCVALYEALYQTSPFYDVDDDGLPARITRVLSGTIAPAPPDTEVPDWLRDVVVRGLSPDSDSRHASMQELGEALLSPSAKDASERLENLQRAHDESVGSRRRVQSGMFIVLAIVAVVAFLYGLNRSATTAFSPKGLLALSIAQFAIVAFVGAHWRDVFLANSYNKRWVLMILGTAGLVTLNRMCSLLMDRAPTDTLVVDTMTVAGALLLSASLSKFFYLATAVGIALAFVAARDPSLARLSFNLVCLLAAVSIWQVWRHKHAEEPRDRRDLQD